ncbi:MAG TPA: NAD-dependent epimerase/dehydratase family protein, partial [Solirubrobacteraceae bacterium]|nr:NAD-dependent epimerase/dehydratase family protein [Solirubrobacteraceae bacterium]
MDLTATPPAPRSVLVTGAHGMLGAWLTAALLDGGHGVVTIRRDGAATSTLELLGRADEVDTVHGDVCEEGLVGRALDDYGVSSV